MGFTNFPGGLTSLGIPVIPGGVPFGPTSKALFVAPGSGSDANNGLTPKRSFATLAKALSVATADANDVVFLIAEDNSSSGTTDYQSSGLDWNKDGVHLVGVNAGGFMGQRSRIAQLSTVLTIDALFTVSASNCFIANIHVFQGVGSSTATTPIAVTVTGERNYFHNCHFAGIGDDDMDVEAAKTLSLSGAAETVFRECTIGLDTVSRGTATSEMLFRSAVTRVLFDRCLFPTYAGATGFTFLDCAASGALDRFVIFKDCIFHNAAESGASAMTEAFDTHASQGGTITLHNTALVGAAVYDAATDGVVHNISPTSGANGDGGIADVTD